MWWDTESNRRGGEGEVSKCCGTALAMGLLLVSITGMNMQHDSEVR